MKTLVIYFSYGGATKKRAEALAAEAGADLVEVRYQKRPGRLGTFLRGCPAAIAQKPAKVEPFSANYASYDKIVVMAPIWASHPAPPFNNIIRALPAGTEVELRLCSSGGESAKEKVVAWVEAQGCTVESYTDIKTSA